MRTFDGAAMGMEAMAEDEILTAEASEMVDVPLPIDETVVEVIAQYCRHETGHDPKAAIHVAHFAVDLFIQQVEDEVRRLETRGTRAQSAYTNRLVTLAKTVRRKMSILYNEVYEASL